MAENFNATCDICGKKYKVCNTCKEVKSFAPWRTITDTMDHYKIFLALSDYTRTKDKKAAKEDLSHCNLDGLESFNDNIRDTIKDIFSEEIVEEKVAVKKVTKKISTNKTKTSEVKNENIE